MQGRLYRSFGDDLKERFGCRVWKVTVAAGFTCPNRDGGRGRGGCIYCNNEGFNPNLRQRLESIHEQVEKGMDLLSKKKRASKFIIYFQPYTNTYASVEDLKNIYDSSLISDDIVGISIGTRPDCVPEEVLDLLESYTGKYMIWLEIGLQSMHDRTLNLINRGHDLATFIDAIIRAKRRRTILLATHIIHGLPGENHEEMMDTVRLVSALGFDGIKFHNLHVMRNTVLERMYREGKVSLLTMEEYVSLVADSLEILPPQTAILRLSGDAPDDILVAPSWCRRKLEIREMINAELKKRRTSQGARYDEKALSMFLEKAMGALRSRPRESRTCIAKAALPL
ncbi:MAG: TIGR01212 family radical SAM protein [Acidobacteriota bacterium]